MAARWKRTTNLSLATTAPSATPAQTADDMQLASNDGAAQTVSALNPDSASPSMKVSIQGMDCQGCVNKIYTGLKKYDGVDTVMIDLESHSGVISYDDQTIEPQRIIEAIEALQFKASVVQ